MKVNIGKYKKNGNPRTIKIEIDNWDMWNLDHTLALIIHPALVKFRKGLDTCGSHPSEITFEEWEEVIDKMIFSFYTISNDWFFEDKFFREGKFYDKEYDEYQEKIQEGLNLFGKWFRALWD